jgi:1-acyl-sn-glycerol-3-phosphate acyltransferase
LSFDKNSKNLPNSICFSHEISNHNFIFSYICSNNLYMKSSLLKIISVLLWSWFLISSIIFTPVLLVIMLLSFLFDRKRKILHLFSCFWGAQYIWVNPFWRLIISGREHIEKGKVYMMISNHQSLVDIVVIYSLFRHFAWTSKLENFKLPFVGWVLSANRSIRIYRNSKQAFDLFRDQALKTIERGSSIMIFPEGTRSKNGQLGSFKEGAFKIIHEMKLDVLPIVLDGTSKAIPKKGWSLTGKQRMILKVLPPVSYVEIADESANETRIRIRTILEKELMKIRNTV